MKTNFSFSRKDTSEEKLSALRCALKEYDTILVGAGAGLSAAAGFTYSGERFHVNFADFEKKYGFTDMYSGGFYPFPAPEEFWAYWSRYIYINRYDQPAGKPYELLFELLREKNYFVLTTNVDHRFQVAGFDKQRLFYTQVCENTQKFPHRSSSEVLDLQKRVKRRCFPASCARPSPLRLNGTAALPASRPCPPFARAALRSARASCAARSFACRKRERCRDAQQQGERCR